MRKKLLMIAAAGLMASACGNKTNGAAGDADSTATDSVLTAEAAQAQQTDTVPRPMYLCLTPSHKYMEMLYWREVTEPTADECGEEFIREVHADWELQESFRRNLPQYKTLLADGKTLHLKFLGEQLTDPDGNPASLGMLHGREGIPAQSARYEVTDAKGKEIWSGIAVTDEYLQTRRRLPIKVEGKEPHYPKLSAQIVATLEKRYGMKAERSKKLYTIDGRYTVGTLQFKGEWKDAPKTMYGNDHVALALEVIALGDSVWACEQLGYYDEAEGPTWNVDDDGEYLPCDILEAFEGPQGLELCYVHHAPESREVGLFLLRGGRYEQLSYAIYHVPYDEELPLWKRDIAEMQRLYKANALEDGTGPLTRYAVINVDMDNQTEIWAREASDNGGGALFLHSADGVQLVSVESSKMKFHFRQKDWNTGYVYIGGSMGGPTYYEKVVKLKGSRIVETLETNRVYDDIDATLNGRKITADQAQAWLDAMPREDYNHNANWQEFNAE